MNQRKVRGERVLRRSHELPLNKLSENHGYAILELAEALQRGQAQQARQKVQVLCAAAEQGADDVNERLARIRAALFARILYDLSVASWSVEVDDGELYVLAPDFSHDRLFSTEERVKAKLQIRRSMVARVQEQLQGASARRLLEELERPPGIEALIADGPRLAARLEQYGTQAIQPYLELARRSDGDEKVTGLPLYSIFRYLRFLWSFPYGDVPGRMLPFLIRDAGQPNSPVCGMLCLASPVLRLSARDHELGLTPAWLEAIVAGLELEPKEETKEELHTALRQHLERLAGAVRALPNGSGPSVERVFTDLALLLEVEPTHDPARLAATLSGLGAQALRLRLNDARRRLCQELVQDLRATIERYHFEGLGVTLQELLADPDPHLELLQKKAISSAEEWKASRAVPDAVADEEESDAPFPAGEPNETAPPGSDDATLVLKKRANQLLSLAKAWKELKPIQRALEADAAALTAALRAATRKAPARGETTVTLSGGVHVSRGLSEALLQRKVNIAATQIAEVSLCGAIPPYNELLLGKLSALLALSRDVADAYHRAYDQRASIIQSQLAGKDYVRSASLLALTTTSFYGVGSAQYNRLSLPNGKTTLRWKEVGLSRGHGTLHFSEETVKLAADLLELKRGQRLITSRFGEGPSERLRKLRDAFSELGLPADELLKHGMERIIFVASLTPCTRPGIREGVTDPSHHLTGPTAAEVIAYWRERWLAGRLSPERLEALKNFKPQQIKLSLRTETDAPLL